MNTEQLCFNGIDGETGKYAQAPLTPQQIIERLQNKPVDHSHNKDLEKRVRSSETGYGLMEGRNPTVLAEAGWGIIFTRDTNPAIREALSELLDYRRALATSIDSRRYQEFSGVRAYRKGESKPDFLERLQAGVSGPVDPDRMPYYLLLVGDPNAIPYSFQYQLDVQHAVGRICFDKLEDYANYARSVVAAEQQRITRGRRASFFGVRNPDDQSTELSCDHLIQPLAATIAQEQSQWQIDAIIKEQATKSRLQQLLGGPETPSLLFTASHGMAFPQESARQRWHQGALLCQNWAGPLQHHGRINEELYLAADDIEATARLLGLIVFNFACYSAGTPEWDEFSHLSERGKTLITPRGFVARLPQRLLSHPQGGALAVVGHVDRAWGYSFSWNRAGQQLQTFQSTLKRLLEGHPIGSAMEFFNQRYAELAADLNYEQKEIQEGGKIPGMDLLGVWTATHDARNYMILGDPAIRLATPPENEPQRETMTLHPTIEPVTLSPSSPPHSQSTVTTVTHTIEPALPNSQIDYGLLDSLKEVRTKLNTMLQQSVDKLSNTMANIVDDATSLEVATYVSDNIETVTYQQGQFTGAKLRAVTRISLGGDTMVCVPEKEGQIDTDLWQIHLDMVKQAQAQRSEVIKSTLAVASSLLETVKKL